MKRLFSGSDEEDQRIYNPLKLPLGWDRKPIPYWLYKLHGLLRNLQPHIGFGLRLLGADAMVIPGLYRIVQLG